MLSSFSKKQLRNSFVLKGRSKPTTKKEVKQSAFVTAAKKAFTFRNVMLLGSLTFFGSRILRGFGGGDGDDEDFLSKALKPPKPTAKLVVRRMDDKLSEYDAAFLAAKNPKAAVALKLQRKQLNMIDSEFEALSPSQVQQLLAAGRKARQINKEFAKVSKTAHQLLTMQYLKLPGPPKPPVVNPDGTIQPALPEGAVRKEVVDPVTGAITVTLELTESKDEAAAENMLAQVVAAKIKNEIMLMKTIELILSANQKTQLLMATSPNLGRTLASSLLKLDSVSQFDFIVDKMHKLEILPVVEAPRVYVLNFKGDTSASQVEKLREEVTGILSVCNKDRGDKVVVVLHSGGGTVTGYGLGAAQLSRIKSAGLPLTVCVDEVAASGGYMMAAVADRILASPFAVLGSVGVIATIPNFSNRLTREGIEVEDITAGKYKRTLTPYKKGTAEDRAKMKSDISEVFELFKDFLKAQRPLLDVEKIATGEVWFGPAALKQGLCDELSTSDDHILSLRRQGSEVYSVSLEYVQKAPGLFGAMEGSIASYITNAVVSYVMGLVQQQMGATSLPGLSALTDVTTREQGVNERFMAYDESFSNGKAPRI